MQITSVPVLLNVMVGNVHQYEMCRGNHEQWKTCINTACINARGLCPLRGVTLLKGKAAIHSLSGHSPSLSLSQWHERDTRQAEEDVDPSANAICWDRGRKGKVCDSIKFLWHQLVTLHRVLNTKKIKYIFWLTTYHRCKCNIPAFSCFHSPVPSCLSGRGLARLMFHGHQ